MKNLQLLLTVFVFFFSTSVFSQFYKPLCTKAFKTTERPVLVESDGFLYVDNLDEIIRNNWKYTEDIKVKTASEIDQTFSANPDHDWVVLSAGFRNELKTIQGKKVAIRTYVVSLHLSEDANFRSMKDVDKRFVYKMDFPHCINSELEIAMFLKNAMRQIDEMAPKEMSSKTMKKQPESIQNVQLAINKTLLIPKDQITITTEEIKEVYPYPFKLVTRQEIHGKIKSGSENEMILNIIWSDKKMNWALMAVDLKTYEVNLSTVIRGYDPKTTKIKVPEGAYLGIEKENKIISAKELKKLASNAEKILTVK